MAKITEQNKEMIKKHVSIVELAKEYFDLKPGRQGKLFINGIVGSAGDGVHDYSSLVIFPETNTFFRYSSRTVGDVIEFVKETHIEGIDSFKGACEFLMKRIDPNFNIENVPRVEKKKLSIADTHKSLISQIKSKQENNNKYIIAYLIANRKIDKDVVYQGIDRGYIRPFLYENKMRSVAFVAYSELGTICAVCERGINFGSHYKHNLDNCDYSRGWVWYPQNDKGEKQIPEKCTLIAAESYISMMSYMSLLKKTDSNWENYVYMSTGSTSHYPAVINAVKKFNPEKIIIAGDNDEAGRKFYENINEELQKTEYGNKVFSDFPELDGADWNDILKIEQDIDHGIGTRINNSKDRVETVKNNATIDRQRNIEYSK